MALRLSVLLLAVAASAAFTPSQDGDFAFVSDQADLNQITTSENNGCQVRRLWGVPDMPAYTGHLFYLRIPKEAFSGKVIGYKATGVEGALPSWLWVDGHHGVLRGVPGSEERGEHRVLVTALPEKGDRCPPVTDIFTIEVKDRKENPIIGTHSEYQCHLGEDETRLIIIINMPFNQITPKQRLNAIMKLAHFMGLDYNAFVIQPHEVFEDKSDDLILHSGLGGAKKKHHKEFTEIMLTVGCSGVLWTKHSILMHQIKEQVSDGTISDVVHLPVKEWRVIRYKQLPYPTRSRRQVGEGSALYDDNGEADDEEDNSGYDDYDDYPPETDELTPVSNVPIVSQGTNKTENDLDVDENIIEKTVEHNFKEVGIVPSENPTDSDQKFTDEPSLAPIIPMYSSTPETRNVPSPTRAEQDITEATTLESEISKNTPYDSFAPSVSREPTMVDSTSERSSTIFGRTTETVEFNFPTNSPPEKQHRTKKMPVISGKYFSYIIPEDVFIDAEDGTNLQLAMYDIEHVPLKASSWVQFDPKTREVYGLPLEEHVSKWEYIIQATDSKGASVSDTLDITVQQHKGRRAVNHEFSMKLNVKKSYPAVVDWQIRALKGLVDLFRDTDMDQITVRGVDLDHEPMEFIWTNDTLPKHFCPRDDIIRLMNILQSNSEGHPSPALLSAMSPELEVTSVAWRGAGACSSPPTLSPPSNPDNYGPVPRNQIDHINATAGKLLLFQVPEDTFYDPEDGSARNLKLSLIRGDRSSVPNFYWLQFDTKNQEFFGVPLEKDIGRREYQLIAEDSRGLTANDGLILEVHPAPPIKATVEFQMTLDPPSQHFLKSPHTMRTFVETLQELFGDSDTSSILIKGVTTNPLVISWYNTSLPVDRCPEQEINKLRKFLVGDDAILTQRADEIMGREFPVISVSMEPMGACSPETTFIKTPEFPPVNKRPNEDPSKTVESDDYLITIIVPIAVIVCMLLIAALIACILHRRRRTGKMSVGDDEERQAFRSKGIPVIFQDELDEKPDPSNKSPVIMKEEKPPLLPPPEYKGGEESPTPRHAPYHPPPPFTASRDTARNSRPKPTPTYRKPPPYVPP